MYIYNYPPTPQPCPTCGHCPICGRSSTPVQPYITWTDTAGNINFQGATENQRYLDPFSVSWDSKTS